jgi:hypothetical protein
MSGSIVTLFLILAAASAGVVASITVPSLFDLVQRRSKSPTSKNEETKGKPSNVTDLGEALSAWRRERDV